MAIEEYVISTLADIPPLVRDFAIANGWIVGGTTSQPTLKHPTLSGAVEFTLKAVQDGSAGTLRDRLVWQGTTQTTYYASACSPMRGTATTPVFVAPTKVILISGLTPEPYMAIVIEYGFNLYRHLYLGNMEKIGNYTGGEVISGNIWGASRSNLPMTWDDITAHQYLFNGYQGAVAAANAGGVKVAHVDNADTWRTFFVSSVATPQSLLNLANAGVLGGFRDAINDIYIARGRNTYSGANILVPINLYAVRSNNLAAIGRPAGIRMVNMIDIEPAASVVVGSASWRCFPAVRKSDTLSFNRPVSSWPTDESSYNLGYAYLEG